MRLRTTIAIELRKLFAQRGTYVGYVVLAVLVGLFVWGIWRHGPPDDLRRAVGDQFIVGGKLLTGPFLPFVLLTLPLALYLLIPLLVATVASGLVAGEKRAGTLRTVITRPVPRTRLLAGKLFAGWLHAASLVLFLGLFGALVGYLVFGRGDLVVMDFQGSSLGVLAEPQALVRLALGYGLGAVAMMAIASLALLLSVVCDNPLTAAGVTVAILLVFQALQLMPYFVWLQPYLVTEHISVYREAFAGVVDWVAVRSSLSYLAGYIVVPAVLAMIIFQRKDVLC